MLKLHFFEQNFFFIKNDSLAKENAIVTILLKIFLQKPQICTPDSKKRREEISIFRTKIIYPQIVLLYMLNPVANPGKNFSSELWKILLELL